MTANALGSWLFHYTGSGGSGSWYGFWSGFGSDLGELMILGSLIALYRNHKCASCLRLGIHKVGETGQRTCNKHSTRSHHVLLTTAHKLRWPGHVAHASEPPAAGSGVIRATIPADFAVPIIQSAAPEPKEPTMSLFTLAEDIEHRFTNHPSESQLIADAHQKISDLLTATAKELVTITADVSPEGREVSLALTKLEEAAQWAHAHVARNQPVTVTGLAPVAPPADLVPPEVPSAPVAPADALANEGVAEPAGAAAPQPALYQFAGVPGAAIDASVWTPAIVKTASGAALFTWSGPGAAPVSANWMLYTGTVLPV